MERIEVAFDMYFCWPPADRQALMAEVAYPVIAQDRWAYEPQPISDRVRYLAPSESREDIGTILARFSRYGLAHALDGVSVQVL